MAVVVRTLLLFKLKSNISNNGKRNARFLIVVSLDFSRFDCFNPHFVSCTALLKKSGFNTLSCTSLLKAKNNITIFLRLYPVNATKIVLRSHFCLNWNMQTQRGLKPRQKFKQSIKICSSKKSIMVESKWDCSKKRLPSTIFSSPEFCDRYFITRQINLSIHRWNHLELMCDSCNEHFNFLDLVSKGL